MTDLCDGVIMLCGASWRIREKQLYLRAREKEIE